MQAAESQVQQVELLSAKFVHTYSEVLRLAQDRKQAAAGLAALQNAQQDDSVWVMRPARAQIRMQVPRAGAMLRSDIEELSKQQEAAASRQKQLTEELSRHGELGEIIIKALHSD